MVSLSHYLYRYLGDGSCFYVDESGLVGIEMTGPDCDPVYCTSHDGVSVYTGCRDGEIRKYSNAWQTRTLHNAFFTVDWGFSMLDQSVLVDN